MIAGKGDASHARKVAAIAATEVIVRKLRKFTVSDVVVHAGVTMATGQVYVKAMLADGRVRLLRAYEGNSKYPAIYGIGTALIPDPEPEEERRPEISMKWPVGGAFRDSLQFAFFGHDRRPV